MVPTTARPPLPVPREVTHALSSTVLPRLLLVGGAGSGKSELLAAVARSVTGNPELRVVDDAHTLGSDEIQAITAEVQHGTTALIVATEPRPQRPELRALTATFAIHANVVELRPWSAREIAGRAAALGVTVRPEQIRAVHRLTTGVPGLVDVALSALDSGDDPTRSVAEHLRDRLCADTELAATLALADIGIAPDTAELTAVLHLDPRRARELVDAACASGLLTADRDALVPGAVGVPAAVLGPHAMRSLAHRLLDGRAGAGLLTLPLALRLAELGIVDPALANYLVDQAEGADAATAVAVFDAAVRAGADADALTSLRAEAAAVAGDLAAAEHLTDRLFERAATLADDELRTATRIAATVAAHRGMLGRSADLYEWLGPGRAGADAHVGATVLLAAGRPEAAATMRAGATAGAPTSAAAAAQLLEAGLRESVGGDGRIAMNSLSRALTVRNGSGRAPLQPVTVESVAALLCLHSGELAHARTVLARAGSDIRHSLLSAWSALLGGDLTTATAAAERLSSRAAHQRDLLFLHGLRVGLARRLGDHAALVVEWNAAQRVVAEYSVDLLSLLPLGELWLAAVRLGEPERIAHLVTQALDLLTVLGEPPLWGATLHWYGVQAAIAANRPSDLVPHARALADAAASTAYAAALARAGNAWLRLLQNDVDPARIRDAAEALARIGLPWDGARLAGEAALRVPDTRAATALLQIARAVRQPAAPATTLPETSPAADRDPAQSGTEPDVSVSPLSAREAEVADLVVSGLTYREVGNRLYISAKTVEHHVARIRRRLGAGSRSELIAMLRAIGHGSDVHDRSRTEKNGGSPACP